MPLKAYQEKIDLEGFLPDSGQERAVHGLERLKNDLLAQKEKFLGFIGKTEVIRGVYMYGGVGRGKSMLMDLFYENIKEIKKARRVHFHEFMIETHNWMHKRRGDMVDTILPDYAKDVSQHVEVLCFDEFYVTDVADAMILGRLFTALFEHGVVVVSTSNWPPDRLYEGGLQRDRFLPFIELLKNKMEVIHLDSENDYRLMAQKVRDTYFTPLSKATTQKLDNLFIGMIGDADIVPDVFEVKGRKIKCDKTANGIARFLFAYLCEQPHGAEDYLAIAKRYHTVFLEGIPKLGYDRRNEVKRLMNLIDVLYDNGIKVIIGADAPADKLYHGSDHAFEFDRTVSRLIEMQGKNYAAL